MSEADCLIRLDNFRGTATLYEVDLTAARARLLRPPMRLVSAHYMPDEGRLGLNGASVYFRTRPSRLDGWLRRIDA